MARRVARQDERRHAIKQLRETLLRRDPHWDLSRVGDVRLLSERDAIHLSSDEESQLDDALTPPDRTSTIQDSIEHALEQYRYNEHRADKPAVVRARLEEHIAATRHLRDLVDRSGRGRHGHVYLTPDGRREVCVSILQALDEYLIECLIDATEADRYWTNHKRARAELGKDVTNALHAERIPIRSGRGGRYVTREAAVEVLRQVRQWAARLDGRAVSDRSCDTFVVEAIEAFQRRQVRRRGDRGVPAQASRARLSSEARREPSQASS